MLMEKLNFKPGFNVYNRISVKNYRDQIICGAAVIVGNGTNARAHLHSATGISEVLPGTGNLIDRVKLAEELDVDLVLINRGRISTVDEMHYQGGYVANFQGVKMTWCGFMIADALFNQLKNAYQPALIFRNSNWIWYAKSEVFLLREPAGTVWVMNEYTRDVLMDLAIDNLRDLGKRYKNLPEGWKFEVKILTEDLSLDTARSDGWASVLRDEFGCTFQACGYDSDTSANYIP
jgi:hypothetical protein